MRRNFDCQSWLPNLAKRGSIIVCASILVSALQGIAQGAALELYPTDIGTAHVGQAALAENASTAASNPAGMTLLDRSQLMTTPGALLPSTNFDVAPQTTTKGGGGGNAGVFFPYGAFFYVHKLSERLRLGVAVDTDFGLNGDYGKTWVVRYYASSEGLVTFKVNPSIAYRVNDWLSVGTGFSFGVGRLTFQSEDQQRTSPRTGWRLLARILGRSVRRLRRNTAEAD